MRNNLYKIYKKLLKYFGPQGWWPIGGVYDPDKKYFSEEEKFEIMAGAILTQNTAWKNVEKALSNLRKENFLDPEKIAKADLRKLQTLVKPSGFYRQKAKRLKNFAAVIGTNVPIRNMTRAKWLEINGVGPETADSILLYALGKPYFVVDAYTRRLINRLGIFKGGNYEDIRKFFGKNIPRNTEIYREYHALIVALAKNFCKKKPDCRGCPVSGYCEKRKNQVCGRFRDGGE